jgi:hypothetical protein
MHGMMAWHGTTVRNHNFQGEPNHNKRDFIKPGARQKQKSSIPQIFGTRTEAPPSAIIMLQ